MCGSIHTLVWFYLMFTKDNIINIMQVTLQLDIIVKCTGAALCRSTGLFQPPYFHVFLCSYILIANMFPIVHRERLWSCSLEVVLYQDIIYVFLQVL